MINSENGKHQESHQSRMKHSEMTIILVEITIEGKIKRLKQEEMVGYRTEAQRGNTTLKPIHWDSIERSKRIHSIGSFN